MNVPRMRLTLLCGLLCVFLTACQTTSGSFCAIAKPQRPSAAEIEAMSDARAGRVLAHNEKGRRLCGWKA